MAQKAQHYFENDPKRYFQLQQKQEMKFFLHQIASDARKSHLLGYFQGKITMHCSAITAIELYFNTKDEYSWFKGFVVYLICSKVLSGISFYNLALPFQKSGKNLYQPSRAMKFEKNDQNKNIYFLEIFFCRKSFGLSLKQTEKTFGNTEVLNITDQTVISKH